MIDRLDLLGINLQLARDLSASAAAAVWRRLMYRTQVVAVTGSHGKSTATDCLGSILSSHSPTNWKPEGGNSRRRLAETIFRTRFRHRFTVMEVGTKLPGALRRASWLIDPDVAVILAVARIHSDSFPDLDAIAAEKEALLGRIHGSRLAILNGDDPRVLAMRDRCRGRILTFGTSSAHDLWASEVSSVWPARLSFCVHRGDESCQVKTQLVGEHWVSSVLGALLAAIAVGVPLHDAVAAVEQYPPRTARMQPVEASTGITFLRDEFNESITSLAPALRVLEQARAQRRIVILGDVYDSPLKERPRLEELGRLAATAADVAIFIGKNMRYAARAAIEAGLPPDAAHSFRELPEVSEFLRAELRPGDLVLLRGASRRHFERLYFAHLGPILCWKKHCPIYRPCDTCHELIRN